jgi:hypothetical protein
MNCASARNRLLSSEPGTVPDAVAGHLAACAGCQAWQRLLVQVDHAVATAPVPATTGRTKRRLVELFRTGRTPGESGTLATASARVVGPAATPVRDRLARYWPAGLVAAAVLVGTVAWVTLGGKPVDSGTVARLPPDPFLQKVVADKVKIDTAETPPERLRAWADLADDLREQARELARVTPDEDSKAMESLANLYEQVVGEDALVGQARELTDEERKAALPKFKDRLARAEEDANRLLAEGVSPDSERPLKRIADAAAASKAKLASLQRGRPS